MGGHPLRRLLPALLLVLIAGSVGAETIRTRITQFKGQGRAQTPGGEKVPLSVRYPIAPGQTIRLDTPAALSIQFADHPSQSWMHKGTTVSLGPETEATLQESEIGEGRRVIRWKLDRGWIYISIDPSIKRAYKTDASFVEITTAGARAKSLGATFHVSVSPRGTWVRALDGEVQVFDTQGADPSAVRKVEPGGSHFVDSQKSGAAEEAPLSF